VILRLVRGATLAIALLGLFAAPAFAGDLTPPSGTPTEADLTRAKELFDNGQQLYDEGRYADAVLAWEQSYRLSGYADLLYNISNAYERDGQYREAIGVLNKYRAFASAEERATLDRRISVLDEKAKAADAEAARVAQLQQQQTTTTTPTTTTTTPPVVDPPKKAPVVPIALISAGAVGLGVGGFYGAQAGGAMKDIQATCSDRGDGTYLCPIDAQPAVDKRGSSATASAVGLGIGGALAAAGIVTLFVGGSSDVSIDVVPSPGGGSLHIGGRF
jgi:tetratricopeptide (TPR) repeat protein